MGEGFVSRWGASSKRRVYRKREAASAMALEADDNQEDEKEKSSLQASLRKRRRICITGGDRLVSDCKAAHTA